jgi:hypothetical protein
MVALISFRFSRYSLWEASLEMISSASSPPGPVVLEDPDQRLHVGIQVRPDHAVKAPQRGYVHEGLLLVDDEELEAAFSG